MDFSFENIDVFAVVEKETETYIHFVLEEQRDRYDSNFIQFIVFPTIQQLQEAEHYMKRFQRMQGQQHVKLSFPQDQEVSIEIRNYLESQGYSIGVLEMYAIRPAVFSKSSVNNEVIVEFVREETLQRYISLHYEDALQWGEGYANGKKGVLERDFTLQRKAQIIARLGEEIVGSVDIIVDLNTAEMDNLLVVPAYQRKGIGTKIQQFVMEQYADRTIILVADGEDTPREMYTKQGYLYIGKQYNALKMKLDL